MSAGYRVLLTPRALKDWKGLPQDVKRAVDRAIEKLAREGRGEKARQGGLALTREGLPNPF